MGEVNIIHLGLLNHRIDKKPAIIITVIEELGISAKLEHI